MSNTGDAPLQIESVEIASLTGDVLDPSVDDFTVELCAARACPLPLTLCVAEPGGCRAVEHLRLTYRNTDSSSEDAAVLLFTSNDPGAPMYRLQVSAEDHPCAAPRPRILVETAARGVGQEVCANCENSFAGGPYDEDRVVGCRWALAIEGATRPLPILTPNPGRRTCFVPVERGAHVLSLVVENSCGARSIEMATDTILIR